MKSKLLQLLVEDTKKILKTEDDQIATSYIDQVIRKTFSEFLNLPPDLRKIVIKHVCDLQG